MRQIHQIHFLEYEGIGFGKFVGVVDRENNPYSLLVTIFAIADNFEWRHYVCHL